MAKTTKTVAKRMGVKSVLAYGEERMAITTFGRGNAAEIAVDAGQRGKGLMIPHRTERFTVNKIDKKIDLEQGDLESILNNPAEQVGEDYLGLKATLEKEFFGKEFPNDNVRIQMIHNILDIQKILGLYVNDIIYCVNNLRDEEVINEKNDIVGLAMGEKTSMKT